MEMAEVQANECNKACQTDYELKSTRLRKKQAKTESPGQEKRHDRSQGRPAEATAKSANADNQIPLHDYQKILEKRNQTNCLQAAYDAAEYLLQRAKKVQAYTEEAQKSICQRTDQAMALQDFYMLQIEHLRSCIATRQRACKVGRNVFWSYELLIANEVQDEETGRLYLCAIETQERLLIAKRMVTERRTLRDQQEVIHKEWYERCAIEYSEAELWASLLTQEFQHIEWVQQEGSASSAATPKSSQTCTSPSSSLPSPRTNLSQLLLPAGLLPARQRPMTPSPRSAVSPAHIYQMVHRPSSPSKNALLLLAQSPNPPNHGTQTLLDGATQTSPGYGSPSPGASYTLGASPPSGPSKSPQWQATPQRSAGASGPTQRSSDPAALRQASLPALASRQSPSPPRGGAGVPLPLDSKVGRLSSPPQSALLLLAQPPNHPPHGPQPNLNGATQSPQASPGYGSPPTGPFKSPWQEAAPQQSAGANGPMERSIDPAALQQALPPALASGQSPSPRGGADRQESARALGRSPELKKMGYASPVKGSSEQLQTTPASHCPSPQQSPTYIILQRVLFPVTAPNVPVPCDTVLRGQSPCPPAGHPVPYWLPGAHGRAASPGPSSPPPAMGASPSPPPPPPPPQQHPSPEAGAQPQHQQPMQASPTMMGPWDCQPQQQPGPSPWAGVSPPHGAAAIAPSALPAELSNDVPCMECQDGIYFSPLRVPPESHQTHVQPYPPSPQQVPQHNPEWDRRSPITAPHIPVPCDVAPRAQSPCPPAGHPVPYWLPGHGPPPGAHGRAALPGPSSPPPPAMDASPSPPPPPHQHPSPEAGAQPQHQRPMQASPTMMGPWDCQPQQQPGPSPWAEVHGASPPHGAAAAAVAPAAALPANVSNAGNLPICQMPPQPLQIAPPYQFLSQQQSPTYCLPQGSPPSITAPHIPVPCDVAPRAQSPCPPAGHPVPYWPPGHGPSPGAHGRAASPGPSSSPPPPQQQQPPSPEAGAQSQHQQPMQASPTMMGPWDCQPQQQPGPLPWAEVHGASPPHGAAAAAPSALPAELDSAGKLVPCMECQGTGYTSPHRPQPGEGSPAHPTAYQQIPTDASPHGTQPADASPHHQLLPPPSGPASHPQAASITAAHVPPYWSPGPTPGTGAHTPPPQVPPGHQLAAPAGRAPCGSPPWTGPPVPLPHEAGSVVGEGGGAAGPYGEARGTGYTSPHRPQPGEGSPAHPTAYQQIPTDASPHGMQPAGTSPQQQLLPSPYAYAPPYALALPYSPASPYDLAASYGPALHSQPTGVAAAYVPPYWSPDPMPPADPNVKNSPDTPANYQRTAAHQLDASLDVSSYPETPSPAKAPSRSDCRGSCMWPTPPSTSLSDYIAVMGTRFAGFPGAKLVYHGKAKRARHSKPRQAPPTPGRMDQVSGPSCPTQSVLPSLDSSVECQAFVPLTLPPNANSPRSGCRTIVHLKRGADGLSQNSLQAPVAQSSSVPHITPGAPAAVPQPFIAPIHGKTGPGRPVMQPQMPAPQPPVFKPVPCLDHITLARAFVADLDDC